jgi:hypothetical protein
MLIPNLSENSVVVMDNATLHKGEIVRMLEEHNHSAPYSPDLNSIEHTCAWIKHIRQKNQKGDIDWPLWECIERLVCLL